MPRFPAAGIFAGSFLKSTADLAIHTQLYATAAILEVNSRAVLCRRGREPRRECFSGGWELFEPDRDPSNKKGGRCRPFLLA
jgi:hypothetical protein